MQRTKAALKQGSTQASTSASSATNNLLGGNAMEQNTVESLVPSIDYLRTNVSFQSEV